ncbi:MAG: hypothetical protein KIS78_33190 [Labilithrix sp.]|nr:hypothetical protein [Labilithrix sp.]MCW5837298.1 hypothetical protein [Labilithrix sp.]
MKKPAIVTLTGLFVFLVMACGGLSNEEACNKVKSSCEASSSDDAGVSSSITVTCEPSSFDKISNDSEVKDCIDKESECGALLACLQKGKPE